MSSPPAPRQPHSRPAPLDDDPPGEETYLVVRHEDGFAYAAKGTLSETFATHARAVEAARQAAAAQRVPGQTVQIRYETSEGVWLTERSDGRDRPVTALDA